MTEEQFESIKQLEDPEEIDAALDILKGEPSEEEDNSTLEEDTTPTETEKVENVEEGKEVAQENFTISDEYIDSQDEETQKILSKYRGKGREDIIKSISHAIALKTPYLKNDPDLINTISKKIKGKTNEELVEMLIDSQRNVGASTRPKETIETKETTSYKDIKIDIDKPEISSLVEEQIISLLRKKYPSMPDGIRSLKDEDYKEWRRDLDIDDPDNNYKDDFKEAKKVVEDNIKKYLFVRNELKNLYVNDPIEVMDKINEADDTALYFLKKLNDNPMQLLTEELNKEVDEIKQWLKEEYDLTEKDLGIDLTIKIKNGIPNNKVLNDLVTIEQNGVKIIDPKVVSRHAKIFWLNKGSVKERFIKKYDKLARTKYFENMISNEKDTRRKLKEATLKEGSGMGASTSGINLNSIEDIDKIDDPQVIDELLKKL